MASYTDGIPQGKILRIFEMINILAIDKVTISSLSQRIDVSQKTCYRYLKLAEEVGFGIEKDFNGRYYLMTTHYPPFIEKLLESIKIEA